MAKRFTDTDKWDDDWFLSLPPRYKCVWSWLCDHCDGIGLQKLSLSKLSFEIGEPINLDDFDKYFGERAHWLSHDTIWIHGFIFAQHKTLYPTNKAHVNIARKALRIVGDRELNFKAQKVIQSLKDFMLLVDGLRAEAAREPDGVRADLIGNRKKEIGKRKKKKEGVGENKTTFDFDALYAKYPRKVNKSGAIKRCQQVIHTPEDYAGLSLAIDNYRAEVERNKTEERFIKHMSTFVEDRESKPFIQPWRDYLEEKKPSAAPLSAWARAKLKEQGVANG